MVEAMAAVEPRRFTVQEYQRMGQTGILGEDDRVELIDGQIVRMTPIGPPHAGTVMALNALFSRLAGDSAVVSVQSPLVIGDFSEPEPDLVLVKPPLARYREAHPGPEDVLLVVEVAHTSGRYDREVKAPLYARAGIPEYWIVDVALGVVEMYRSPSGDRYARVIQMGPDDRVAASALPGVELSVSEILG